MAEENKDVDSNGDQMLYVVLVAAGAGLLLAILSVWACYYFSRLSKKNRKSKSRSGSSKEKRTKAKKEKDLEMEVSDENEDGDEDADQHSWLPISIVRFSPFHPTSRNRDACDDASSIDHQSVGQESTHSAGTMSMFSYLRGIRRAAQQLGGVQFLFHAGDNDTKKEEQTATTEEKSSSGSSGGSSEEERYNDSFLDMDILEDIDEEDFLEEDDDDDTFDYEYDEECNPTAAAPSLDTAAAHQTSITTTCSL